MALWPFPQPISVPPSRGILDRLRKVQRPDLFKHGVRQLLHGLQPSELTTDDIRAIASDYGIDWEKSVADRVALWAEVLANLTTSTPLSDELPRYVDTLRSLLDLTHDQVASSRYEIVAPIFRDALVHAVRDSRVTEEEREDLDSLAAILAIPHEEGRAALERTVRALFDSAFDVFRGEGFTIERVKFMRALQADLAVVPRWRQEEMLSRLESKWNVNDGTGDAEKSDIEQQHIDQQNAQQRQHLRLAEQIVEVATVPFLPVISVRDLGQGREPCYWDQPCERLEWRAQSSNRFDPQVLLAVDRGTLELTNRQVLFLGARTELRVPYDLLKQLDVNAHNFSIQLRSGDSFHFRLEFDMQCQLLVAFVRRLAANVSITGAD